MYCHFKHRLRRKEGRCFPYALSLERKKTFFFLKKGLKTMKKMLALALAVLMILTVAAGCGSEQGGSSSSSSQSTASSGSESSGESESSESSGSGEPRELTISIGDIGVEDVSYADGLPIWNEIEKKLNVKVNWEVLPGGDQYNTSAQTRLAAGQNLPDIIQVPGGASDVLKYAKQGVIIKLNDLIDNDADMTAFLEEYPEYKKGITDPDGNIYFFTNMLLDMDNGRGMSVRKDWLKKLDMEMPQTLEDWEKFLYAVKSTDLNENGENDEIPFGGDPRWFYSAFGMNVAQSDEVYYSINDGKLMYDAMRDEYKDWLTFAHKLYADGMLDPMYGSGQSQINDLISKNLVASIQDNPGDCDNRNDALTATGVTDAEYTWTFTPLDSTGRNRWTPTPTAKGGVFYAITKDAKDPQLAMEFISYCVANKEGQRTALMGIEGEHWDEVDGQVVFKDFMLNDPQYNIILMCRRIGGFSFLDVQTREFNIARGVRKYKEGLDLILENDGKYEPAVPILMSTESETSEINSLWPDLKNYIDEMKFKFIMGEEPIDNFDQFRSTPSSMGIDRLTEIYQGMYDRYQNG